MSENCRVMSGGKQNECGPGERGRYGKEVGIVSHISMVGKH
jgi:hypothetical protein